MDVMQGIFRKVVLVFSLLNFTGCALVTIDSGTPIEPVDQSIEAAIFLDWGNCPKFYAGVVDGGKEAVARSMLAGASNYNLVISQNVPESAFKLTFNCSHSSKPRRLDQYGGHQAPGYHMLSLGLIPAVEDFPETMGMKVEDLRAGQAELIDENVQKGVTENYLWSILISPPAVWFQMIAGPTTSEAHLQAIEKSVQGLVSQAINAYVFE